MEENTKSDWHQQLDFSQMFFKLTQYCRGFQIQGDIPGWKNALESKMSLVQGIFEKDEEFKQLKQFREAILKSWAGYLKENSMKGMGATKSMANLSNTLYCVEAELDKLVNTRMPFLNIRKDDDISGL